MENTHQKLYRRESKKNKEKEKQWKIESNHGFKKNPLEHTKKKLKFWKMTTETRDYKYNNHKTKGQENQ